MRFARSAQLANCSEALANPLTKALISLCRDRELVGPEGLEPPTKAL